MYNVLFSIVFSVIIIFGFENNYTRSFPDCQGLHANCYSFLPKQINKLANYEKITYNIYGKDQIKQNKAVQNDK